MTARRIQPRVLDSVAAHRASAIEQAEECGETRHREIRQQQHAWSPASMSNRTASSDADASDTGAVCRRPAAPVASAFPDDEGPGADAAPLRPTPNPPGSDVVFRSARLNIDTAFNVVSSVAPTILPASSSETSLSMCSAWICSLLMLDRLRMR